MNEPLLRAKHLLNQRRYDLALFEVERYLAEAPDSAYGHCLRGFCLNELGQSQEAEQAARQAIELQPDQPLAFYILARALHARKDHRQALTAIDTAIELHPESGEYWSQKADIQFALYRWKEAIASTDEALALDAEDTQALLLRSHALHALGRTREADEMSRRALEIEPDLAMAHFEQGWALLRMGKPRPAEQRFLEALRIDANLTPAREGLKEAIRARFAPYRWITSYRHWLRRFSPKVTMGILIGAMVVVNSLPRMVSEDSPLHIPALLIVFAYAIFAYLTWISGPLSNFFLRFHPQGRHALTGDERCGTRVLGAIFVGAALLGTGWFTLPELSKMAVLTCLGLGIPGAAIYLSRPGNQRRTMALITMGLLLMGPVAYILISWGDLKLGTPLGDAVLFGVKNFWLGVAISTWVSSGMSVRESDA